MNGAHPARRQPGSTYWLIAKDQSDRVEVLTIEFDGERALPVFSFEEEAEMFLRLEVLEEGWWTRETTAGELISLLYGPCAGVKRVALDPLPAVCGGEAMLDLVSLERKDFAQTLTRRDGWSAPRRGLLLQAEELEAPILLRSLR